MNKHEGITVVMVTHDHHVARMADRIIMIRDGEVVQDGGDRL
ncbi:hypothetical protein LJR153_007214 [Paenibacillus sp. LjRoot153]